MNVKRIKACLPYVIFGYVFNRLSWLYGYTSGNVLERTMETAGNVGLAFKSFIPSFYPKDLLVGVIAGASLWGIVYYKRKTAKKYRHGMEYGSARWGNAKDIAAYKDPSSEQSLRAVFAWNALYPDKMIELPAKVKLVKLNIFTVDDMKDLAKTHPREYDIIMDKVFHDTTGFFISVTHDKKTNTEKTKVNMCISSLFLK